MKRFSLHFNVHSLTHSVHSHVQIVFLNNFENFRPSFKNETLLQESFPRYVKTLGSFNVHTFNNQVNTVVGAHMKEYKKNGKQQLDNPNYGSYGQLRRGDKISSSFELHNAHAPQMSIQRHKVSSHPFSPPLRTSVYIKAGFPLCRCVGGWIAYYGVDYEIR